MDESEYAAIERRIERFILTAGAAMTAGAAIGWGIPAGEGAAVGTALCWLNFRWLRQGAAAVIRLGMAQAGAEVVHVPRMIHAKFFGRLVLLLVVVYVILAWLRLPVVAVLCGLAAVVPAIVLELVYELLHGHHRWNAL
ncbi:MAG TPA: ATP synthase subunit I [Candidatus Limnocylindrales bacterium]|nr:ATP synthase subunit I [Candidatus Limnocylindrales bacterium]